MDDHPPYNGRKKTLLTIETLGNMQDKLKNASELTGSRNGDVNFVRGLQKNETPWEKWVRRHKSTFFEELVPEKNTRNPRKKFRGMPAAIREVPGCTVVTAFH